MLGTERGGLRSKVNGSSFKADVALDSPYYPCRLMLVYLALTYTNVRRRLDTSRGQHSKPTGGTPSHWHAKTISEALSPDKPKSGKACETKRSEAQPQRLNDHHMS